MPDRETVIDKLNDMADYLLTKSYSDLLARDFYETVGYTLALLKEQDEQIRIKTENFNRLVAKVEVMPKIIQCKDCIHAEQRLGRYTCYFDEENESGCKRSHNADWFCADGERRTDDA